MPPVNNIESTRHTLSSFKSSRFSFGDRRQLQTIGKEDVNKNRRCKLCSSCTPGRFFALALLLALFLAALAVIPASLFALKTTTTTPICMNSIKIDFYIVTNISCIRPDTIDYR